MNTANNQKFKHTQQRMEQALLALCKTGDPHKITVTQICQEAHINRSTFYAHFQDIPDMIHKVGVSHIEQMIAFFHDSEDIMQFFVEEAHVIRLLTYVQDNREFFATLIGSNSYKFIHTSLYRLWDRGARAYMEKVGLTDETDMKYHFTFFWAGYLAVLGRWLSSGCQESPEHLARLLLKNMPKH